MDQSTPQAMSQGIYQGVSRRRRIQPAPENFLTLEDIARRRFLRRSLALGGALTAAGAAGVASAQAPDPILQLPEHSKTLGQPVAARGYGVPSKHESNVQRRESPGLTRTSLSSIAFAPLQSLFGIITPSGVHFERHHAGWHDIDPAQHRLMIHGLVRQAKVYTMDDLMRLPSVSRMHFIECGANTGMEWGNVAVPTVQYTHGMLSCSEFTGVALSTLLDDVGFDAAKARFVLAEGADGASLTRSVPIDMALDDVMVVYGQNGEMLRPENGYPLRLLVPGVQGVSSVKWLRRLEVGHEPWNTREEALHYIDLMPDGVHRQYTWINECKSVITSPSGGQVLLDRGYCEITGLAWSGRGRVRRVDVSVDGGRNWRDARLQEPVLTKCLTRFRYDWVWDGSPAIVQSRAIDETGYVQPQIRQLRAVRGTRAIYHNNAIQSWQIAESGEVSNVQVY
ncbi:MAG TPA: sulfite dehydrogenase [Burkholderiales bacterium]|jgi:sulfane dehydrogenase subunit SoxC